MINCHPPERRQSRRALIVVIVLVALVVLHRDGVDVEAAASALAEVAVAGVFVVRLALGAHLPDSSPDGLR